VVKISSDFVLCFCSRGLRGLLAKAFGVRGWHPPLPLYGGRGKPGFVLAMSGLHHQPARTEHLSVCFKNPKRTDFLGDLIGWADKKTHEIEISY